MKKILFGIIVLASFFVLFGCVNPPVCGNGVCEVGETPQNCPMSNGGDCPPENNLCGNGVVDINEQCDDADNVSLDGCSSTCQIEIVCNDSDGNNWFTKGTTTESINGVIMPGRNADDYCNDANTLTEYICTDPFYTNNQLHMSVGAGGKCAYGCEDGACKTETQEIKLNCYEDIKSGLCGIVGRIFPLQNKVEVQQNSSYLIYGPGVIFEDENFKLTLSGPHKMMQNVESSFNLEIENKKSSSTVFNYNFLFAPATLSVLYADSSFLNNFAGAQVVQGPKSQNYYALSLSPLEKRTTQFVLKPINPVIYSSEGSLAYLLFYYFPGNFNTQTMMTYSFESEIDVNSDPTFYIDKEGNPRRIDPQLVFCDGRNFSLNLFISVTGEAMPSNYGYSTSKCCTNIFYPDADCCYNSDCLESDLFSGQCLDGKCMLKQKPTNRLFGNKRVLASTEFNTSDTCEISSPQELSLISSTYFDKVELYYDYMANVIIGKDANFVNFTVAKGLKLPSSFRGLIDFSYSDANIVSALNTACNIDSNSYDIIMLPTEATSLGGAAGFAWGVGNSKVIFSSPGNQPTLIHELGHLFGCNDLYNTSGGRLQWAFSLYGANRANDFNMQSLSPYTLINNNRISDLPEKTFQVCRGELGWVDDNNNGLIDVEE